jgi:phosphoribosylformimino-5-aminoimidazole carboxamide ribotide isomerase
MDVLNSKVVHAVKGNRQEYQPLRSVLTNSVNPLEVAAVFKRQGFSDLYLADLDAILGNRPNFDLYRGLVEMGFNFIVDAGVTELETAKRLCACGVSKVIVGTETLTSIEFVTEAVKQLGAKHILVSLDMKANKILTHPNFDSSTEIFELLKQFCVRGLSEFILLDLSRVGSSEGVNIGLLKQILTVLKKDCESGGGVYVGGGIQGIDDLFNLKELNVLGVLLATALHSGKIDSIVLERAGLF